MRLVVDGRPAFGGIHRVVRGLIAGLRARADACDLEVIGDGGDHPVPADDRLAPMRRVMRPVLGNVRRVAIDQIGLGWAARRAAPDLVHSPHGVVPFHRPRPWIVSLWDLSPVTPEFACGPPPMRRYRSWCFHRAISHADHIIVPSDAVRCDLIDRFHLPEGRVTTIYPLFGPLLEPPAGPSAEPRHLLHVGTLEPRKNLDLLLDAYALLDPADRPPLVMVGRYGWRQRAQIERIERMGPTVRWLGEVDDVQLGRLYHHAAVLVQPSLDEGFDLPLVEGLNAGVPVVASDIRVHREVAGDCALLAPANDPEALAAAVLDAIGWNGELRRVKASAARARVAVLASSDPVSEHIRIYRRLTERGIET